MQDTVPRDDVVAEADRRIETLRNGMPAWMLADMAEGRFSQDEANLYLLRLVVLSPNVWLETTKPKKTRRHGANGMTRPARLIRLAEAYHAFPKPPPGTTKFEAFFEKRKDLFLALRLTIGTVDALRTRLSEGREARARRDKLRSLIACLVPPIGGKISRKQLLRECDTEAALNAALLRQHGATQALLHWAPCASE